MSRNTFDRVLTEIINEIAQTGYDDAAMADRYIARLREAAAADLPSALQMENTLKAHLRAVYKRRVEQGSALRFHPGVTKFQLDRISPSLRADLDRRILAAADLIKLNRKRAIELTLQRAQGWLTSVPSGGSRAIDRRSVKKDLSKAFRSMGYEERRVVVDQGHKLASAIDATIADQTGAIAAEWNSHWRRPGYDYREDHKERDGKVYAIRNNWAIQRGWMNKGAGYTDEMTQPGEEIFCSCYFRYINDLRGLPDAMLTEKGKQELAGHKIKLRA